MPQAAGEPRDLAQARRQQRLDLRPHQPRQHRRIAFRRNSHGQRRAFDDGGGVEIAFRRHVDDIERNAQPPRLGLGDLRRRALLRYEHQRCPGNVGLRHGTLEDRHREARKVGLDVLGVNLY